MQTNRTPSDLAHLTGSDGDRKIERLAAAWWQPDVDALLWLSSVLEYATLRVGAVLQTSSTHPPEWFAIAADGSIVVRTDAGPAMVSTVGVDAIVEKRGVARTTLVDAAPVWIGHRSVLPAVLAAAPALLAQSRLRRAG